jgi:hypothetical protein
MRVLDVGGRGITKVGDGEGVYGEVGNVDILRGVGAIYCIRR